MLLALVKERRVLMFNFKKFNRLFCTAFFICSIFLVADTTVFAAGNERLRTGILGFDGNVSYEYLKSATDQLGETIYNLNRFDIIERSRLDAIMAEHKWNLSGLVDPDTTTKLGKILGIEIGFFGTINSLSTKYEQGDRYSYYKGHTQVTVTVIDMETGQIKGIIRQGGSGTASNSNEAAHNAIRESLGVAMGQEIAKIFILESRIIDIQGKYVYISLGSNTGAKKGSYFRVKHPTITKLNNIELSPEDFFYEEVGIVKVENVSPNISRAKIVKGEEHIRVGDALEEIPDYKDPVKTLLQSLGTGLLLTLLIIYYLMNYEEIKA